MKLNGVMVATVVVVVKINRFNAAGNLFLPIKSKSVSVNHGGYTTVRF